MEPSATVAVGDGQTAAAAVSAKEAPANLAAVASEELPMPTAAGNSSLRSRLRCIALLFAAAVMASVFIGVPLAAALRMFVYQPVLGIILAVAITAELALMVTLVILRTEKSAW